MSRASVSSVDWMRGILAIPSFALLALAAGPAASAPGSFCSNTANLQLEACRHEVEDDYLVARAICINVSDGEERAECAGDARADRREERQVCREQRIARGELCDGIGEARYEPDFDPELFDDDFSNLTNPNPYFPLGIGNLSVFESEDETTTIEVLNKTKLIDGVTCIVVNDVVEEDGDLIEDTDDWFGQRKDGTIDYCGETVRDFEYFEGDNPREPELVETDGAFKAGRDGDASGTLFPGNPVVGSVYRQEWSANNAEDAAIVISTTYKWANGGELNDWVPQGLAELMCDDTPCVVTGEFSPIDPGEFERKYFAFGVGKFLEVDVESGEFSELVSCNYHAKCDDL